MFVDQDPSNFNEAERVIGNVKNGGAYRGNYTHAKAFENWVAQNGMDRPAFTNIGRWRSSQGESRDGPVYIRWLTVDIDDSDLVDAYDKARLVTEAAISVGLDPERIVCSFSGAKGFHIQVDATQIGLKPLQSEEAARIFLETWTKSLCEQRFWDQAVCSPRCLIRLTGSTHQESGLRKRSFLAPEFLERGLDGVMKGVRSEYKGFDLPERGDPTPGIDDYLEQLYKDADAAFRRMRRRTNTKRSDGRDKNGIMSIIRNGVSQGQHFGPRSFHVGRENATFIMGCWLIETEKSNRLARKKLFQWNALNDPPLPTGRVKAQWRGAKRKMQANKRAS